MFTLTPKTSKMSGRPVSKELKLFEAMENLTNLEDSVDPSASLIQKFVNCDLDLNNTQQTIAEEEEDVPPGSSILAGNLNKKAFLTGLSRLQNRKGKTVSFCEDYEQVSVIERLSESEEEEDQDDNNDTRHSTSSCDDDFDDGNSVQNYYGEDDVEDESTNAENPSSKTLNHRQDYVEDISDVIETAVMKKHGTELLLLSEIKRSLELKEMQLERERESFTEQQKAEQKKLKAEIQRVENQRKSLQRLITDYHKLKSSRDEEEVKMKELTNKLRETKLEMSKRIARWGGQQKKLEERVKNLEKENEDLKKQKVVGQRSTLLKRPPLGLNGARNSMEKSKPTKKIQFADEAEEGSKSKLEKQVSRTRSDSNNDSGISTGNFDSYDELKGDTLSKSDVSVGKEPESGSHRVVSINEPDADQTMSSDYIEIIHPCGTITRATKDGRHIRHVMTNNDTMDEFEDGSVRYYYGTQQFSQTTYTNGDEIIEYDSGAVETRRANGSRIYTFPCGLVKYVDALGEEEVSFSDGSVMKKKANGECAITWPSGQKEVRTSSYVKRIYPNGTVKIMYSDGSEETKYWNGRIRRKDRNGVLVDDTKPKKKLARKKSAQNYSTM